LARSTIDSDSLPKFGSGQVNREDARDALRGSCSGLAALAHLLHAVHEGDTILNERQKMCAVDPSPPAFYRELDQYSRLIGNPRVLRKMLDYPGFHSVLQDPKIVDLQRDPELLADMRSGNLLGVFSNRKVLALLNDPRLRQVFSLGELKAALDYAGDTSKDDEQHPL